MLKHLPEKAEQLGPCGDCGGSGRVGVTRQFAVDRRVYALYHDTTVKQMIARMAENVGMDLSKPIKSEEDHLKHVVRFWQKTLEECRRCDGCGFAPVVAKPVERIVPSKPADPVIRPRRAINKGKAAS